MKIKIPFTGRSRERILDGRKIATTRMKRYGRPGDTFDVDGWKYRLTEVYRAELQEVVNFWYTEEGAESPDEFEEIWKSIHPRAGYQPRKKVWLHVFEKVKS